MYFTVPVLIVTFMSTKIQVIKLNFKKPRVYCLKKPAIPVNTPKISKLPETRSLMVAGNTHFDSRRKNTQSPKTIVDGSERKTAILSFAAPRLVGRVWSVEPGDFRQFVGCRVLSSCARSFGSARGNNTTLTLDPESWPRATRTAVVEPGPIVNGLEPTRAWNTRQNGRWNDRDDDDDDDEDDDEDDEGDDGDDGDDYQWRWGKMGRWNREKKKGARLHVKACF